MVILTICQLANSQGTLSQISDMFAPIYNAGVQRQCKDQPLAVVCLPRHRELALAPPRYVFDEPIRCWQLPNVPLGRSKVVFGSKLGLDSNPASGRLWRNLVV